MIAWLKGTITEKTPSNVVLDVNGVGYRLFITLSTYEKLPDNGCEAQLHAVTIAREDALHLYGFFEADEKEMFLKLISVTKVGPKLACQVLSGLNAEGVRRAILIGDQDSLSRAPGIGRKTSERIIMELKEKLGPPLEATPAEQNINEAVAALENLGYKRTLAHKTVSKVARKKADAELSELIRESLKELSPMSNS